MLASELIKRARSLSDTPNSQFISNEDEIQSLYESWKDIYSKITDSSDDYYISSAIINTSTAILIGENEWEVTIPSDVYKVRYLNYKDNGRWVNMNKFNTNNRNKASGQPMYRFRGNKLWVIATAIPQELRIDYYPPPIKISVPEDSYSYCQTIAPYNVSTLVSYPNFFSIPNPNNSDNSDYMLYIYNGLNIRLESTTYQTTATLYTSLAAMSNVIYNAGFIYYLQAGDIYKSSTTLTGTLIPVAITAIGTITYFTIQNNIIYYSTADNSYSCKLDGTSSILLYTSPMKGLAVIGSDIYTLSTAGIINLNNTPNGLNATYLSGDGEYIYFINFFNDLRKYSSTFSETIAEDITYIGVPKNGFISTISVDFDVKAISTAEDTNFIYPINEANEIMAYQCAVDFKRKQNGDISALSLRLGQIQERFMSVIIRDAYQPERRVPESYTGFYL